MAKQRASAISVAGQLKPIDPVYTKPNNPNALGIRSPYPIPSQTVDTTETGIPSILSAPVVRRAQDTSGMRYLYSDARRRQPLSKLGTGKNIGIAVNSGAFQPFKGDMADYGFYDKLFRAGYPGFNLGLSFKVQPYPTMRDNPNGPGFNMTMKAPPTRLSINVLRRSNARPTTTG